MEPSSRPARPRVQLGRDVVDQTFSMTQPKTPHCPVVATETNEMIRTARSLHRFVKKVNENGYYDTKSDILLFEGAFVAVPILLAFATELALKALLYRGGYEKREKTHDLARIYKKLDKELRDAIEEKVPIPYPPHLVKALQLDILPDCMTVNDILEYHKDAFMDWRYLHERHISEESQEKSFHTGVLERVFAAIIAVYDESYSHRR